MGHVRSHFRVKSLPVVCGGIYTLSSSISSAVGFKIIFKIKNIIEAKHKLVSSS